MTVNFYLARHGQTRWNKAKRYQGQLDSELTALGQQQSADIAMQLMDKNIDLIAYSPLGRATASAMICQQKLISPLYCEVGLMERNLGVWQGQYHHQVKNDQHYHELLQQVTQRCPTGGESAVSCGKRIFQALLSLAQRFENKNILVIFHGEALRCFLAEIAVNTTGNAYQLFSNGCVIPLNYQADIKSFSLAS